MKQSQVGFTLVELIVVIVILGILAATALPRFVGLQGEARAGVIKGIAASMETAKSLVQARWLADGTTPASVPLAAAPSGAVFVITTGTSATNGFPLASTTGIVEAIIVPTGVACALVATSIECEYTGLTGCSAIYSVAGDVTTTTATATACGG